MFESYADAANSWGGPRQDKEAIARAGTVAALWHDWRNGKRYYPYDGALLVALPTAERLRPNTIGDFALETRKAVKSAASSRPDGETRAPAVESSTVRDFDVLRNFCHET